MKKKLVFGSMLMVLLGLALVLGGCDTGGEDGGNFIPPPGGGDNGTAEWDGEYWEVNHDINPDQNSAKGTLNLSAKTLTVVQTGSNSNYSAFTLTNVSIGPTTDVNWGDSSLRHSAKWAYVYKDSTKIGLIRKSTMSMTGYSETDYSLEIGQKWGSAFTMAATPPLDLSDMDETYKFSGDK